MGDFFECFACREVSPMSTEEKACPLCGSIKGQVISGELLKEGLEAGTYFSRDAEGKRIGRSSDAATGPDRSKP